MSTPDDNVKEESSGSVAIVASAVSVGALFALLSVLAWRRKSKKTQRRRRVEEITEAQEMDRRELDLEKPSIALPGGIPSPVPPTAPSISSSANSMVPGSSPHHKGVQTLRVIAPPGKLGVVVDTPPGGGSAFVCEIKVSSPLKEEVRLGDQIAEVDGEDVRGMPALQVSRLLASKRKQAERKITVLREENEAAGTLSTLDLDSQDPEIDEMAEEMTNYIDTETAIEWRRMEIRLPSGRLGVILAAPEHPEPPGPAYVHEIREFSPLKGRMRLMDRIVAVDGQDVSEMTAVNVSKLLGSKSRNPERRVGVLRRVVRGEEEEEGEDLVDASGPDTAGGGDHKEAKPTTGGGDGGYEC